MNSSKKKTYKKVPVAILGTGNIGMDLMYKLKRSSVLEIGLIAGVDPQSDGVARARKEGLRVSVNGIQELVDNPDLAEIAIDATTAKAHIMHAKVLQDMGKWAIDLTPASLGAQIVPIINLVENYDKPNVSLISCGAQATIPIAWAIKEAAGSENVKYAEIVATISSKSAGPGTRQNIDEFTQATRKGIINVGGIKSAKAIIILNPAEPPIMMHDTIYVLLNKDPDKDAITENVLRVVQELQKYVPGYELKTGPLFDGKKVTVMVQVTGAGDYLPKYAGNLDIITSAAVATAEKMAQLHFNIA